MTLAFYNGVPVVQTNQVTQDAPEFYISYNPSIRDYGVRTTAIYIKSTGQFLILAGDHRQGYEGLKFKEALEYFYAHVDEVVSQSEHGKIFKFTDGNAVYVDGGF